MTILIYMGENPREIPLSKYSRDHEIQGIESMKRERELQTSPGNHGGKIQSKDCLMQSEQTKPTK